MTNSNHLRNPVTKSLNDLCQDELSVIGSYLGAWNDLWSLTFTSSEMKKCLIHQQTDELWKFFFKEFFPYIPLPTEDFYKNFMKNYKIWYQTLYRVKQDPFFLMYLDKLKEDPAHLFRNDKEIIIAAIEKQPFLYKNFSRGYKEDEEVILCALKNNRFIIHDVPRTVREGFKEIADIKEDKARVYACDLLIEKLSPQRVSKIKSLDLFKSQLTLQAQNITKKSGEQVNNRQLQRSTAPITPEGITSLVHLGLFRDTQIQYEEKEESLHNKYRK
ncbi:TPA: Dot/Icm type IV secretion system effector Ceg29 [Legionella pneumophila]